MMDDHAMGSERAAQGPGIRHCPASQPHACGVERRSHGDHPPSHRPCSCCGHSTTIFTRIKSDMLYGPLGKFVAIMAVYALVSGGMLYVMYYHSPPSHADLWVDVMEAYHGAGMECHAVVVDRILRMADALDDVPYAVDAGGGTRAVAASAVLGGDWRPPECGG